MNRISRRLGLGLLLAVLTTVSAVAQEVYVATELNKILKIDFATGTTEVLVDGQGEYLALAVRPGTNLTPARLLASNAMWPGEILVFDTETAESARVVRFRDAVSVALTAEGDVIAVNSRANQNRRQLLYIPIKPGCADTVTGPFAAGCGPAGYGEAFFVDEDIDVPGMTPEDIVDVREARHSIPGLVEAGQILVLVEDPPMLLAYSPVNHGFSHCNGLCEPEVVLDPTDLPYQPKGIDLANDSLLITTRRERVILKVTAAEDGIPMVAPVSDADVVEFYSLPNRGAKIAVGIDDDSLVAYPTVPLQNEAGSVLQIDATTGALLDSVEMLSRPIGISTESTRAVPVPPGFNVKVILNQLEVTFTQITKGGFFDSSCTYYDHPDPGCEDTNSCGDLFLSDLDPNLPSVLVPSYVQPFPIGGENGPLQYLVCTVGTTASFFDAYTAVHDEANSIGYEPVCETYDEDTENEIRMFYAPIPGVDPEIVEGSQFIGITSDCFNSHSGRGWKFSYIMPAVRDLRSTDDNIKDKQTGLGETFEAAKDDILGECPDLIPGGGVVPQAAFTAAGLGSRDSSWAHVPASSGIFGSSGVGGNGLLLGGGTVEFQVKIAGFDHEFGTSDGSGANQEVIIASTVGAGGTYLYEPTPDPYLFYFTNIYAYEAGLEGQTAYSDGMATDGRLDVQIYRNLSDPREFAIFFDDGGAGPDRDYTDTIVTARGLVEAQCTVELAIADGDLAVFGDGECGECYGEGCPGAPQLLDYEEGGSCEIQYEDLIWSLVEIRTVLDRQPEAFLDPMDRNTVGEFRARVDAEIFQACKPIGGHLDVCPVQPEDDHDYEDEE